MSNPALEPREVTGEHWITRAEASLDGALDPSVDVLRAGPPPLLDAHGRRAIMAPLLAAFLWSAATFVAQLRGELDSIALLLRLFALCLTVRSVIVLATLLGRVRVYFQYRRHALALADEGMLLRTPFADVALQKSDIVDMRIQSTTHSGRGLVWAELYLVTRPQSGRCWLGLPPIFARTPELLLEQLTQWRGELTAAASDAAPSTTVVEARRGLPRRGPYATMLLGVVLLESFLRLPDPARVQVGGWVAAVIAGCLLVVPALWFGVARFRNGPKGRPLLTLDSTGFSVARGAGQRRVPWTQVTRVETRLRSSWSLVLGAHEVRELQIGSFDASATRLSEERVGMPVEVVCALCDAYRHQHIH